MKNVFHTILSEDIKQNSGSTWLYSCKTADEQKKFEIFQRADISLKTFIVFWTISSAVSFYFKLRLFEYNISKLSLFSVIFGAVFELCLGIILLGFFYYVKYFKLMSEKCEFKIKILGYLENLYVITLTVSRILTIVTFILNGQCHHNQNNISDSAACSSGSAHQMPEGLMAILMVYPMLLSMIVKSVKSETVFFCWALTVASLSILFVMYDYHLSLSSFVALTLISFMKVWEFQRQKISMFFLSQELRGTQTENERLEKENRASELKHLIGNVAHDLKTVS
jgi:hypothetical protein